MKDSVRTVFVKVTTLLLLILFSIGLYILANSDPYWHKQIQLATVRNPETLTELYFENHTQLPNFVELDRDYSYAFTIHNLEGKDLRYPYKIYIDTGEKQLPLASGSAFIKDGGSKTIQQTLLQHTQKGRVKVVVLLPDQHQQIDFWIQTP